VSFIESEGVRVYHGDCIEVMRTLPDNSVDSIVTDPPYGLEFMGKDWDSPWKDHRSKIGRGGDYPNGGKAPTLPQAYIAGAGFQLWFTEVATEALRVLKPGGHLLAFGGTRTWHRLAVAIEDAGFEVRDSIAWMYGSGFPKSLDVSKAIDKKRDESHDAERRDVILTVTNWVAEARNVAGITNRQIDEHFGFAGMAGHWTSSRSQPSVPTAEQWPRLLELFGVEEPPQEVRDAVDEWLRIKGQLAPTWSLREVTGQYTQPTAQQAWMQNYSDHVALPPKERRDNPATDAAKQWQGWGTALKPAHEPIVVARKPLIGTVAENVLTHGTGALNIDGCRIAGEPRTTHTDGNKRTKTDGPTMREGFGVRLRATAAPAGRWPANVILDESQAAALDAQSGVTTSNVGLRGSLSSDGSHEGWKREAHAGFNGLRGHADTGGASRFFYVAKAGKKERPNVDGVAHPTVKPIALMRYLVRLVTPPGGTVLEPFAGSGTTVEACILEGFDCIAIEMTDDYLPLIAERVRRSTEDKEGRLL
jgi:DNA modification methylase